MTSFANAPVEGRGACPLPAAGCLGHAPVYRDVTQLQSVESPDHGYGLTRSNLLAAATSFSDRSQSTGCAFPLTVIGSVRQPSAVTIVSGALAAPVANTTRYVAAVPGQLMLRSGAVGSPLRRLASRTMTAGEANIRVTVCGFGLSTLAEMVTLRKSAGARCSAVLRGGDQVTLRVARMSAVPPGPDT